MEKVFSEDGEQYIIVCRTLENNYGLQRFQRRWDGEEEVEYWVRVQPDPGGRYADVSTAVKNAKEILSRV